MGGAICCDSCYDLPNEKYHGLGDQDDKSYHVQDCRVQAVKDYGVLSSWRKDACWDWKHDDLEGLHLAGKDCGHGDEAKDEP